MRIVVLVGLPGSGKSTYLEQMGVRGLSSDGIRKLLADDATDQTIHVRVFQTLRYLLGQRLAIGRAVTYIDATNLTREERRPDLESGRARACDGEAAFFEVPLQVLWGGAGPSRRRGRGCPAPCGRTPAWRGRRAGSVCWGAGGGENGPRGWPPR